MARTAPALSQRRFTAISRAISDPRRFEILRRIAAQPCLACSSLRDDLPITAATLSHHISELEAAGLVETSRRGKFVDMTFCREIWDAYLADLKKL